MNIAYFTSVYARASDTFVRSEVIELRKRGHVVRTFSIRRDAQDASVSEEVRAEQASTDYLLERGAWRLLSAFLGTALKHPKRMAKTFRLAQKTRTPGVGGAFMHLVYIVEAAYLARRLQALEIRILHNHIAENSATVAMYASLLSGIPFSMTVHGPGIFFHPRQWALGKKVERSAFTACITNFCRSQCMLFAPASAWPKIHIVHCAVGSSFEAVGAKAMPQAPRFVFVGRLCAEKGLAVLVEAVARHVESGKPCELVLIGDGPLRGDVQRVIEQRALHGSIRIIGWKNSAEVRDEIEASRALILPSFAEGLPVALMESLALRRPVIATQIAGIPELVSHRVNGWLVAPGSVDDLVQAIGEAVDAPVSRLQEMGEEGARRVRASHHLQTEVDRLETLLKRHGQ